jgi:kynurenine formamidase
MRCRCRILTAVGHWGHSASGLYYNGHKHDEVTKGNNLGVESKCCPSELARVNIQPTADWTKRGGIVGRGVLLDYVAYAARNNISYSPMSSHAITVPELEAMARDAHLTFLPGDILMVRTGWTKWYDAASNADRAKYVTNAYEWCGVKGCEETMAWVWDNRFSACASDNNGFEVVPMDKDWRMHDFLLPLWGMPIGEMWDLEELAKMCEAEGRWSFFVTSAPLNLKGGCASPPNALAIF